jgi:NAD(P)-dependent dehydrogenase (short-subunit alcohol dehydrogenase family)
MDNIKHDIRVNCVCPSWVDTPMTRNIIAQFPPLDKFILSQLPRGRMALPEEIADVIVFLCSPRASWVTGTYFTVDGAMTLGPYTPALPEQNVE